MVETMASSAILDEEAEAACRVWCDRHPVRGLSFDERGPLTVNGVALQGATIADPLATVIRGAK